jgi:hypothetical protein
VNFGALGLAVPFLHRRHPRVAALGVEQTMQPGTRNIQVPEPRGVLSPGLKLHLAAVFDPADHRLGCDWGYSDRPTSAVFMPPLASRRFPLSERFRL